MICVFCNSHQLSRLAASFIDPRAEWSTVGSVRYSSFVIFRSPFTRFFTLQRATHAALFRSHMIHTFQWSFRRFTYGNLVTTFTSSKRSSSIAFSSEAQLAKAGLGDNRTTSLGRSIGSSDGRCVQRAGTQSTRGHDSRLLGIPRLRVTITRLCPDHDRDSSRSPGPVDPGNGLPVWTGAPKDRPPSGAVSFHSAPTIVARVQPRTSKGITDLLSLDLVRLTHQRRRSVKFTKFSVRLGCRAFKRNGKRPLIRHASFESRPLSESTRQNVPRTKNGHAPPFARSRKSFRSVNPFHVRAGWVFPRWVELSRRLHSWWCPSVNSFKFQLCDHTPPGTRKLRFPSRAAKSASFLGRWRPPR